MSITGGSPSNRDDSSGASLKGGIAIILGGSVIVGLIGLGIGYVYTRGIESLAAPGSSSAAPGPDAPPVELAPAVYAPPSPTPRQIAALEGASAVTWAQQDVTWTLPNAWTKESGAASSAVYASGGMSLAGTVSPVAYAGAVESGLQSFYGSAQRKLKGGAYDDVRYLELDGVKGVLWRESKTIGPTTPRRLQWLGYRTRKGETQSVGVIISGPGSQFAESEDLLYAILYSTKIAHEAPPVSDTPPR